MTEKHLVYLQPKPVRIWHWLNALGILALCLSGAQIRFPEYLSFLGNYKAAVMLHNTAGYVVSVSFVFWLVYYALFARSMAKLYVPKLDDLQHGVLRQLKYYLLTYFIGWENPHHPTPENKFNPLQKSAYLAIMFVLVPLVCLTGLILANVEPLQGLIVLLGGMKILIGLHFLLACSLCAFLFTHVYLATLGHTPLEHFKQMWTGWEEVEEQHPQTTLDH
jgi:thiosulfate reductase cytochrome b subunit